MTVARAEAYVRRLSGMDTIDARALTTLLDQLGADREVRLLARYYEQFDRIIEQETQRGATASTERSKKQIGELVERFLQKPGLSDALLDDARQLLAEIDDAAP